MTLPAAHCNACFLARMRRRAIAARCQLNPPRAVAASAASAELKLGSFARCKFGKACAVCRAPR